MLVRLLRCDAMLQSDLRPTCIPSPLPSPSPHITFWYYVPLDSTLPQGPEIHLQFPRFWEERSVERIAFGLLSHLTLGTNGLMRNQHPALNTPLSLTPIRQLTLSHNGLPKSTSYTGDSCLHVACSGSELARDEVNDLTLLKDAVRRGDVGLHKFNMFRIVLDVIISVRNRVKLDNEGMRDSMLGVRQHCVCWSGTLGSSNVPGDPRSTCPCHQQRT